MALSIETFVFLFVCFCFLKILFIYSLKTHGERQRHRQREKQAPCRDPDVGLDPGSLGSRPGPKAGAKPLRHPGIPEFMFYSLLVLLSLDTVPKKQAFHC